MHMCSSLQLNIRSSHPGSPSFISVCPAKLPASALHLRLVQNQNQMHPSRFVQKPKHLQKMGQRMIGRRVPLEDENIVGGTCRQNTTDHSVYSMFNGAISIELVRNILAYFQGSVETAVEILSMIQSREPWTIVSAKGTVKKASPMHAVAQTLRHPKDGESEYQDGASEHTGTRKEAMHMMAIAQEGRKKSMILAAVAHHLGHRACAADLCKKAALFLDLVNEADAQASLSTFIARNRSETVYIDLHGQHVKEALCLLECHLGALSQLPNFKVISVITGQGSHNADCQAKIKPAVIDYLEKKQVRWAEKTPGCIQIDMLYARKVYLLMHDAKDRRMAAGKTHPEVGKSVEGTPTESTTAEFVHSMLQGPIGLKLVRGVFAHFQGDMKTAVEILLILESREPWIIPTRHGRVRKTPPMYAVSSGPRPEGEYEKARASASEHWNASKESKKLAAIADNLGDRAGAVDLYKKAKSHREVAKQADAQASLSIFTALNKRKTVQIDLHGQHVKYALLLLECQLRALQQLPSFNAISVITGQSSSSADCQAKIKPAVIDYLDKKKVRWVERSLGCIQIDISARGESTKDIASQKLDQYFGRPLSEVTSNMN